MVEQAMTLLRRFYPPESLFLEKMTHVSTATPYVIGTFRVPLDTTYSTVVLNYVTAEQYVRCFSQLAYGFMYLTCLDPHEATFCKDPSSFEHCMLSGQMWYRRLHMRFISSVHKANSFELRMELRQIRRVKQCTIVSLLAKGPVFVTSEFVAPF